MQRHPAVRRLLGSAGHALTLSRALSAPLVYQAIVDARMNLAAVLVAAAMLSDSCDGALVRRFGTPSTAGAWFDVVADLAVIVAAYAGLSAVLGWAPTVAILACFVVFVATSGRAPRYDPVGRYIGAVLLPAALLAVAVPDMLVQLSVVPVVVSACVITMGRRLLV